MEHTISNLLRSYEHGNLSRRDLVRGLTLMAAASAPASAQGTTGNGINHVSVYVSDLQKSTDFYQRALGAKVEKRDGNNALTIGRGRIVLRPGKPAGKVDHFAVGIDKFNQAAVTADLKTRGIATQQGTDVGFHIMDPDGYPVQLISSDAA